MKNIVILGSTGSIGTQTVDVIRSLKMHKIVGLAANSNIDLLERQIREFHPRIVNVYEESHAKQLRDRVRDTSTKITYGMDGLIEVATISECELLVVSVSGMIGLIPTLEAIKNKINIAIATKEILVSAGKIIMECAAQYGVSINPIDSEHCAIKQCLKDNYKHIINRIILTGSGGPFRGKTKEYLKNVTISETLNHPNWSMGKKISVDSATLMNKGLEVIEARWLFDIPQDKITVVIHPQSIIHSMVEYIDGSILGQLAPKDMRIPIQYALTYPTVNYSDIPKLNLFSQELSFEEPDDDNFGMLKLCYDALSIGETMPCVLNGANEQAVKLFLNGKISFLEIHHLVKECMNKHIVINNPDINDIIRCDTWARETVSELK